MKVSTPFSGSVRTLPPRECFAGLIPKEFAFGGTPPGTGERTHNL